jgi:2'-5' RNA ligase
VVRTRTRRTLRRRPSRGNIGAQNMYKDPVPWDRTNSFALVSYIPEPLASFLDSLRQELVPDCYLKAHVTVLPPRPVSAPEAAWTAISNRLAPFTPFEVRMSDVEVFPVSDVIYINVGRGSEELRRMHDALAVDGLKFQEQFEYHPHVTLAQELDPAELEKLVAVARGRWAEFAIDKSFRVEKAVFVHNTGGNCWEDLAEYSLGHADSEMHDKLTGLLAR